MDWTQVTSVAVTGAVGIAGVAGTITAARLSINAEDRRARLADKRRVYAHAIAAMDAAVTAAKAERLNLSDVSATDMAARRETALLAAANAMGELQLAGPQPIADLAPRTMADLTAFCQQKIDDGRIAEARQSLFDALCADLDQEAQRLRA